MATYYAELTGGEIVASVGFEGGAIYAEETLSGGEIYPGGGGGGASLETKSVSYTPSETAISDTLTPSAGYDGFDEVDVSVEAIPSTYVGSGVPRRDSLDLSTSGATVNVPSGFYEYNSSATIPSAPLPTLSSATIDNSGNLGVTANLSGDGYLQSGTLPLTLANAFTVQGAQTITPTTTDQTISADQYLTGNQTILGDADLVAGNIKKDVEIFGVTGTYEGGAITGDQLYTYWNTRQRIEFTTGSADNIRLYGIKATSIYTGAMTGASGMYSAQYFIWGDNLTTVVCPNITRASVDFIKGSNIQKIDIGRLTRIEMQGLRSNPKLKTLVIRTNSVAVLVNINALNGTPFASSGVGGTLYVPSSLIASYQSASNWSTILGYANNSIKSIESTHTDPDAPIDLTLYYADGTPIS